MGKIKRMIAREGLIFLGLAIALYFFSIIFFQNVPVVLPKYKLEFASGEVYTISINPEIRNNSNYKKLLEEGYNPSPKLIEKRIREFVKAGNIRAALKSSRYINSSQVYLSRLYSRLLGVNFILKLAIVYLVLLLIRFIVWAVTFLKRDSRK